MNIIKIGNYELNKINKYFIGSGAFSVVYLGKYIGITNNNISFGTEVAIKIINCKNINSKTLDIFNTEITIMNLIKKNPNPNIVGCYKD